MAEQKVGSDTAAKLYQSPQVKPPTIDEVRELSSKLRLGCSEEDLKVFHEHMTLTARDYDKLLNIPEPQLPVKYPRVPGYRPQPEDNKYNAWYWKCDISGAKSGLLAGKSVCIKDNIAVAGVPMMNGCKQMEGYVPEFDATVVTRVLDAGGRIAGKATCEDLCFSGSGFLTSTGPVLNPHNTSHMPGGSSSGCAVLVSTGEIDMAIGGDQGGSIRIPAGFCGIVGLKPTFGLVPYTGISGIELTIDHTGPMARTVEDCALLLQAIAGYDGARDPRQPRDLKVPEYTKLLTTDLTGKKIGILKEGFGFPESEADVDEMVRNAAQSLTRAGATVSEVSIPLHKYGKAVWAPVCLEGAYQLMLLGNGGGYHWKGHYPVSMMEAQARGQALRPHDYSQSNKLLALFGEYMRTNYQNKFYAKAQNLTTVITEAYDKALQEYDVLVMPTLPHKAGRLPTENDTLHDQLTLSFSMLANTAVFDSTGHPALTINTGMSEGLPVGMMIVGRHFDETSVLQVARAYENLRDKK